MNDVAFLLEKNDQEAAIQLLLKSVALTEKNSKRTGEGVAPGWYEKLATIYRKQKRYAEEVAILERFESQTKAPGVTPKKLAERLVKARILRDREKA